MVWGFESPPAHQLFFLERLMTQVRRLTTACLLATAGCAFPALGQQERAAPFDLYYNVYPEWKVQTFGTPSTAGTDVGTLGTLRSNTTVLSRDANPKERTEDHEWSNS